MANRNGQCFLDYSNGITQTEADLVEKRTMIQQSTLINKIHKIYSQLFKFWNRYKYVWFKLNEKWAKKCLISAFQWSFHKIPEPKNFNDLTLSENVCINYKFRYKTHLCSWINLSLFRIDKKHAKECGSCDSWTSLTNWIGRMTNLS